MKQFKWNEVKNRVLRIERDISFDQIVEAIKEGKLLDRLKHPNLERYPNQEILVVEISGYAYLVPFVEDEEYFFLKTVYKSRNATRKYLKEEG